MAICLGELEIGDGSCHQDTYCPNLITAQTWQQAENNSGTIYRLILKRTNHNYAVQYLKD